MDVVPTDIGVHSSLELVTEPDTYTPGVDDIGNYIDIIPSFNVITHGLRCPCGTRKDKTYNTSSTFSSHCKTKTHQKWLYNLNLNKANYYIENEKLKKTLQTQRIIIAKMDNELQNNRMTIDYLTRQLSSNTGKGKVVNNLILFD
jgi:hypothetical protein